MRITVEEERHAYIIRLSGELDASTCLEVDKEIEMALLKPISQLWVDCDDLKYISSAGLGVFISHLQTMEARNINFVFYNMKEQIYSVFELLGLHDLMTIVPTRQEAEALSV